MSYTVKVVDNPDTLLNKLIDNIRLSVIPNVAPMLRKKFPDTWKLTPCTVTSKWNGICESIKNFQVFEDDVWLISFPKSGTTWCQEMVWLICNNLDYEGAQSYINHRFPHIDEDAIFNDKDNINSIENVRNMKQPRFIKSHIPATLLPHEIWTKNPKVVYIARNAKDMVISLYQYSLNLLGFTYSFDEFMERYLSNKLPYSPHYSHVADFHALKLEPNILFLTYEEMKKDLKSVIIRTAQFFNRHFNDYELDKLVKHLSFESMKANKYVNHENIIDQFYRLRGEEIPENAKFMRKGIVGSWKSEMPEKYAEMINQHILEKNPDDELLSILL